MWKFGFCATALSWIKLKNIICQNEDFGTSWSPPPPGKNGKRTHHGHLSRSKSSHPITLQLLQMIFVMGLLSFLSSVNHCTFSLFVEGMWFVVLAWHDFRHAVMCMLDRSSRLRMQSSYAWDYNGCMTFICVPKPEKFVIMNVFTNVGKQMFKEMWPSWYEGMLCGLKFHVHASSSWLRYYASAHKFSVQHGWRMLDKSEGNFCRLSGEKWHMLWLGSVMVLNWLKSALFEVWTRVQSVVMVVIHVISLHWRVVMWKRW